MTPLVELYLLININLNLVHSSHDLDITQDFVNLITQKEINSLGKLKEIQVHGEDFFILGAGQGDSTPFKKLDNAETSSNAKNCGPEKVVNNEGLLEEDVEIVLDTLMNFCNQDGEKNIDEVELVEVFDSFDETKPSVEEVQEAFDVFDENGDGYIDANELKKVICKMGFLEFSVEDCQRMIVPFDDNIDGRIEFGEFVKLMEHIFQ